MNLQRTNRRLLTQFSLALGFAFLCCCMKAGAQQPEAQPLPSSPSSPEAEALGQIREASTFFGEPFKGHWSFNGDISAGQDYDDNVFPSSGLRTSDTMSQFSLRLSTGVKKKRLTFQAHYLPQYTMHAKYDQSNSFSQQYSQDLLYRWSARTDLGWNASVSRIETGSSSPSLLVQFTPDSAASVFYPSALQQNTKILTTGSSFSLSHRFTPRLTMKSGLTGSFTKFTPSNGIPLIASLANQSFQVGGNVGWDYEVVTGKKIGVQVTDSYAGFLNPSAHQDYQSALLTYSQMLPGRFSFSAGVGPSFSRVHGASFGPGSVDISYAANVSLSRTMRGYNLGVSLNRGSQLGTIQGTLATLSTSVSASKTLWRRWQTGASFSYSQMRGLQSLEQTESYSVSSSAGYSLTPDLLVQLRYSYVDQLSDSLVSQSYDRNLYGAALVYTFGNHRRQ